MLSIYGNLYFGEFGFLLTAIASVFLILIFIPHCFPTWFILLVNSESLFSFPANRAVSSVLLTCVSNIFCVDYSLAASGIFLVFIF